MPNLQYFSTMANTKSVPNDQQSEIGYMAIRVGAFRLSLVVATTWQHLFKLPVVETQNVWDLPLE